MTVSITSKGTWAKTDAFLGKMSKLDISAQLNAYGAAGVDALAHATPTRTGLTASSWFYRVSKSGTTWFLSWYNSNIHEGVPVAILLQYGHGTGTGGYVAGEDYINPAIRPIFDEIANNVWKAVTSA
jgi:hypothetical protein